MPVKTMNQSITCSHSGSRGTARAMGVDKGPLVTVAAPLASEEDVQRIYNWIDEIPLSRPKRPALSSEALSCELFKHHFSMKLLRLFFTRS